VWYALEVYFFINVSAATKKLIQLASGIRHSLRGNDGWSLNWIPACAGMAETA
jgi:hypothetical protein